MTDDSKCARISKLILNCDNSITAQRILRRKKAVDESLAYRNFYFANRLDVANWDGMSQRIRRKPLVNIASEHKVQQTYWTSKMSKLV